MKVSHVLCDVCHAPIPEGARSFALSLSLTVRNGHARNTGRTLDDLCGDACLHAALTALVREA